MLLKLKGNQNYFLTNEEAVKVAENIEKKRITFLKRLNGLMVSEFQIEYFGPLSQDFVGKEIFADADGILYYHDGKDWNFWHILPPLEFLFEGASSDLERIRSYEYKWGGKKEQMVRAELPSDIIKRLTLYSEMAFVVTDCCDYARMDYRIDHDGNIYFLEVNYNPGIGPNTHGLNNTLTMMASFEGYSFEDLIERIVLLAMERYKAAR